MTQSLTDVHVHAQAYPTALQLYIEYFRSFVLMYHNAQNEKMNE